MRVSNTATYILLMDTLSNILNSLSRLGLWEGIIVQDAGFWVKNTGLLPSSVANFTESYIKVTLIGILETLNVKEASISCWVPEPYENLFVS